MDLFEMLLARTGKGGGGGGGFTPTQDQLDAMNSGIDSDKVADIAEMKPKVARIIMDSTETTNVYVQATQPTGIIPEGSIWFDTAVSGT